MPAGREMDALVAERVMGWHREGRGQSVSPFHWRDANGDLYGIDWDSKGEHDILVDPTGYRVYLCPCREEKGDEVELPCYSTDIAAAWLVVDRFGGRVTLMGEGAVNDDDGEYQREEPGWMAVITVYEDSYWEQLFSKAEGETPMLAICRAALKAVKATS